MIHSTMILIATHNGNDIINLIIVQKYHNQGEIKQSIEFSVDTNDHLVLY